jgi:hypothetical protein
VRSADNPEFKALGILVLAILGAEFPESLDKE